MSVFMVERNLAGISVEDLGSAQQAAMATARKMTAEGERISYIRSTFAPGDGRCFCLFDAENETQVRKLNDAAGLPYTAVTQAFDLTP